MDLSPATIAKDLRPPTINLPHRSVRRCSFMEEKKRKKKRKIKNCSFFSLSLSLSFFSSGLSCRCWRALKFGFLLSFSCFSVSSVWP